jgi:hypothetical protein
MGNSHKSDSECDHNGSTTPLAGLRCAMGERQCAMRDIAVASVSPDAKLASENYTCIPTKLRIAYEPMFYALVLFSTSLKIIFFLLKNSFYLVFRYYVVVFFYLFYRQASFELLEFSLLNNQQFFYFFVH